MKLSKPSWHPLYTSQSVQIFVAFYLFAFIVALIYINFSLLVPFSYHLTLSSRELYDCFLYLTPFLFASIILPYPSFSRHSSGSSLYRLAPKPTINTVTIPRFLNKLQTALICGAGLLYYIYLWSLSLDNSTRITSKVITATTYGVISFLIFSLSISAVYLSATNSMTRLYSIIISILVSNIVVTVDSSRYSCIPLVLLFVSMYIRKHYLSSIFLLLYAVAVLGFSLISRSTAYIGSSLLPSTILIVPSLHVINAFLSYTFAFSAANLTNSVLNFSSQDLHPLYILNSINPLPSFWGGDLFQQ